MALMGKIFAGISIASAVASSVMTYNQKKEEGATQGSALTAAAFDFVGWQVAAPVMVGLMINDSAPSIFEGATMLGRQSRQYVNNQYKANFGGNYVDSMGAATMRQAGLGTIQESRQRTGRAGIGGEAKQYYRR